MSLPSAAAMACGQLNGPNQCGNARVAKPPSPDTVSVKLSSLMKLLGEAKDRTSQCRGLLGISQPEPSDRTLDTSDIWQQICTAETLADMILIDLNDLTNRLGG